MQPFSSAIAENLRDLFAPMMQPAAAGNARIEVPLIISGREIARAITPNLDKEMQRQATLKRRGV
jgi:hypothetical protein